MRMRAQGVWGILAILAGVGAIWAHPPESRKAIVDGKVPSPLVQDFYQAEPHPPRLLPTSITESLPPRLAPPVASDELTSPIQRVSFTSTSTPVLTRARLTFALAESHYESCEAAQAQSWYREVIRIAPGSPFALAAAARLNGKLAKRVGIDQSPEPPFADSSPATIPPSVTRD